MSKAYLSACFAAVSCGLLLSGCTEPDQPPPAAEVKTVEAYGVTLDPEATPREVVYVLLRSVADDYAAAAAKDSKAQREAFETTYSLAAPKTMERRLVQTLNQLNPEVKKESLGDKRDAKLWDTVHKWAPIIGHYVPSFREIDLATLKDRSWVAITPDGQTAHVYLPVSHDPTADPSDTDTATIEVELNREAAQAGGPEYWRISRVGFLGRQFGMPALQTVRAYGMTLDASATPEQVVAVVLRSLGEMHEAEERGDRDLWASAMYRVFVLTDPSGLVSGDNDESRADVVSGWGEQAAGAVDLSAVTPEQVRAMAADGRTTEAVYTDQTGGAVTVTMQPATAGDQRYWQVTGISASCEAPGGASKGAAVAAPTSAGPASAGPASATQPATRSQ